MAKVSIEQRIARELKNVRAALRRDDIPDGDRHALYGAQQALCWLLDPRAAMRPDKAFARQRTKKAA